MDPVQADLIQTIALEAIKILGPAVVAALAAYFSASAQFRSQLVQSRETNEFSARQHLFDYYKDRQKKLSEGSKSLGEGLGSALGVASFGAGAQQDASLGEMVKVLAGTAQLYLGMAPFEIQITLRDMKQKNLGETEEFKKLMEYAQKVPKLTFGYAPEELRVIAFALLDMYGFLERCNQLLLEKEMERLFDKYLGRRT